MSALSDRPITPYPPIQNGKEKRGGLILPADFAQLLTAAERAKLGSLLAITATSAPLGVTAGNLAIAAASGVSAGYLSAADYLTFHTPPHVRVYNNANISIPNNAVTNLTFNSERWDTDAFHSTSANTDRLVVPTGRGGLYLVGCGVEFAGNATGERIILLTDSAAVNYGYRRWTPGTANQQDEPVVTLVRLADAAYMVCQVFQNSGGALNVNSVGGISPEFWMYRIGD